MPRATNKPAARHRKRKILKLAKGYRQGRSRQYKRAKEFAERGLTYAYRDRKQRKRDFRRLWIVRISAACKKGGISYSSFIHRLNVLGVNLNRKMLAEMAYNRPDEFNQIIKQIKEVAQDSNKI
ncbi:MAG: 50S ribosomal protein L20 [Candidatus Omnitrophica bacterium]|nr:50S ribosomal protein L20 [Candidatus Omnitrophota bacterium]MCM8788909.1 50S ribosomal protein L20 [Candidatus Omnitrophota bacterium]